MPVYDYRCSKGHLSEAYSTIANRRNPRHCRCGELVELVILKPPRVFGDYEGYESPATGKWIEGRVARERDLAESGCRPYELGEREEMLKRQEANDRKVDEFVDRVVDQTLTELTL